MLTELLAERQRFLNRRWFLRDCGVIALAELAQATGGRE